MPVKAYTLFQVLVLCFGIRAWLPCWYYTGMMCAGWGSKSNSKSSIFLVKNKHLVINLLLKANAMCSFRTRSKKLCDNKHLEWFVSFY